MNSAADALAIIRARLAELESRAAARRTRDADLAADHAPAPKAPAKSGRKKTEDEPAMQGRDWLTEAREDLLRVDMAATMAGRLSKRRERPSVAPEYASEASSGDTLQRSTPENRTEPTAKVGGNADVPAAGKHEELRDGSPQPAAVPAASEVSKSEGAKSPLSTSGAATHGARKMPQARVEHWTVRMARINANVLTASFAPSLPIASPYDLPKPVRDDPRPAAVAGCGPPGW